MKMGFFKTTMLILLFLVSSLAFGFQYNFLKSSPAFYFNDQDWKLYMDAAENALDHHQNGSKVTWSNPQSGHSGYFIPTKTIQKNGRTCRDLKIYINGQSRQDISYFQVCKYPSGWKVPGDN